MADTTPTRTTHHVLHEHKRGGLGQLASTAICGDDITSSCLYVSALSIVYAGRWAHVALLLVALVLWMVRRIYAEVVGALPLNGGVLTSCVGVGGLVRRMTLDRCLPQFLLKTNRRGTSHRILLGFFLLTVSILLITGGELKALAGVYTLSYLAVMALFGVGNILLKVKRDRLPRPTRAPGAWCCWPSWRSCWAWWATRS